MSKRIAIMQPYLFPYIGYFQLIGAVDKFVVYDDVTFIKQGWINRNNILLNGKPYMFTVPLVNVSSNTRICDTEVSYKFNWNAKFLKTVGQAYRKAPFFAEVYPLIEEVLQGDEKYISGLAVRSLRAFSAYMGLSTEIQESSRMYGNDQLTAQDRVLDICLIEEADHYINPIGGQELYSKEAFAQQGIRLDFIQTGAITYNQYSDAFTPWLSMIDVLMFNSPAEALALTRNYELI